MNKSDIKLRNKISQNNTNENYFEFIKNYSQLSSVVYVQWNVRREEIFITQHDKLLLRQLIMKTNWISLH